MAATKSGADRWKGPLDLMVLSVLVDGPQYGYRISQSVREASRDQIKLAAGTLYPLLHRLEEDRLIRSRWDDASGRKRKWYELTAAGRKRLTEQANDWSAFAEQLQAILAPVLSSLRSQTAPR